MLAFDTVVLSELPGGLSVSPFSLDTSGVFEVPPDSSIGVVKPAVVLKSLAVLVANLAVLAEVAVILSGYIVVISFVPAKIMKTHVIYILQLFSVVKASLLRKQIVIVSVVDFQK